VRPLYLDGLVFALRSASIARPRTSPSQAQMLETGVTCGSVLPFAYAHWSHSGGPHCSTALSPRLDRNGNRRTARAGASNRVRHGRGGRFKGMTSCLKAAVERCSVDLYCRKILYVAADLNCRQ